jgi:hypothetical protein
MTQLNLQQAYSRQNWQNWLTEIFASQIQIETQAESVDIDHDNIKSIQRFASVKLADGKTLAVFDIEILAGVQISRNRVGLRNLVEKFIDHARYHGILAFYHSDTLVEYRMSFISSEPKIDDSGNFIIEHTSPKRYTYLLGKNVKTKTPADRLNIIAAKQGTATLEDITKAFSVETLAKEFYAELFVWYQWALSGEIGVTFPNEIENKKIDEHLIRLITRLMFVWFIKQKNLVPETIFDIDKLKSILKNFNATDSEQDNYYRAILQNLFFATLNNKIEDRNFAVDGTFQENRVQYGIKTLYRYADDFSISNDEVVELFGNVPFLNGGLFECLDKDTPDSNGKIVYCDGFSRRKDRQSRAHIPNILFFDKDKGIIPLLGKYNFTIEENTPDDVNVALDPELLGKVFENLLGTYNPETKETARKQSGSFYTPREIVHYMVKTSLDEYEKNGGNLDKIKILDPACGSGAFPMGILNEIIERKKQQNPNLNLYETKLNIIENSIYGIDVQPIAIQISKLRFFISLIVEQKPNDNPNVNYGILPLPNLEAKFVAANTLIALDESKKDQLNLHDTTLQEMKNELWKIRNHRNLRASSWQEKVRLRKDDKELCEQIEKYLVENTIKPNEKRIADNRVLIEKCKIEMSELKPEWVDDYETQMSLFGGNETPKKLFQKDLNEPKRNKLAERIKLLEAEIAKEEKKGQLTGLEAEIKKMTGWDLYNQNASSPFFDMEWMFGLKVGFDIVIGNPPYLRIQGIRDTNSAFADFLSKTYKAATGSFDLYVVFVERSLNLIDSNGLVNFIMPTKWTNAAFGKGLRQIISDKNAANRIINFGAYQVFNASTYTGIQYFKPNSNGLMYYELDRDLKSNTELAIYLQTLTPIQGTFLANEKLTKDIWTLTAGSSSKIIDKLNLQPRRISDVFEKIFQGLATSKDDVYFLYDCVIENNEVVGLSKQLSKTTRIEREFVKPLLKGEDVHRYEKIITNRYVVFPYKLMNGNAELYKEEEIKYQFPLAYVYLKECEDVLRDREKGRFNIDGEWFQFGRKQGISFAEKEKLVAPEISLGGNFSYDKNGDFYHTTKVYGYLKKNNVNESYFFWLALFNSKLFWYFIQQTGYVLRGGYYTFKTNYILPFPIPQVINIKSCFLIEELVKKILEKKEISHQNNTFAEEAEINELIYELYDLTTDEIEEIEI